MEHQRWEEKSKPRQPRERDSSAHGCNCRKSKCLKLYCECFAAATLCTDMLCKCQDCHNNSDHLEERNRACDETVRKNARAFEPKIAKDQAQADDPSHRRGCRCKKSNCLKRYCECFNGKVKCTQVCRCNNCQNMFDTEPVEQVQKPPAEEEEEEEETTVPVPKESPSTPKKEGDLEQMNSYMSPPMRHTGPTMSPTMTPLLASANWDMNNHGGSFAGGVFACSPLRPEDLASLMPSHMATPQPKSDDLGNMSNVPAFSPGLHPVDEIDPNEPMSFLISPVKGSPFKSPMKSSPAPGNRAIFMRSSLTDTQKTDSNFRIKTVAETSMRPSQSVQQKIVGSCFASPMKPARTAESTPTDPFAHTPADGPPSGLLPRRTSPRKRDVSALGKSSSLTGLEQPSVSHRNDKGLPPRAPNTPDHSSPPFKKRRPDHSHLSPHVSPMWSRSPHAKKQNLASKELAASFVSPLGVRDQTSPHPCRNPTVSTIKLSPMCTRVVDPPATLESTPQLNGTKMEPFDSTVRQSPAKWTAREPLPAAVQ